VTIADDVLSGRARIEKVADEVTNFEISPDGKRPSSAPAGYLHVRQERQHPEPDPDSGRPRENSKWSPDGR